MSPLGDQCNESEAAKQRWEMKALHKVPSSLCHNKTWLCYDDIISSATLLGAMKKSWAVDEHFTVATTQPPEHETTPQRLHFSLWLSLIWEKLK